MTIQAVEELGAQRLVHGVTGGEMLTITLPADAPLGESLRLTASPQAIHRFDEKSGARLD